MVKKAKEKSKTRNTKDEQTLNIDNEIIIGIKPLPEPKGAKKIKKQVKKQNQKRQNSKIKNEKKQNSQNNRKNTKIRQNTKIKKENNKTKYEKVKPKTNEINWQEIEDFETFRNGTKKKNVKKAVSKKKKQKDVKQYETEEMEFNWGLAEETIKKKNPPKLTKKQIIAKKKRKIAFRIIKYTTLLFLLVGLGIYFMLSPFFNIKNITTDGNEKITSEELISLSQINLEENTFKLQKSQIEERIKENPYIDTVVVKRKLPSTIHIQVTERKPILMLTFANAYVYVGKQGYLLEISQNPLDVPIITGFVTPEEEIHAGNRLCNEDLQRLEQAIQIIKVAESNDIASLITKINIQDKQNYILELKSENKTVHLGDNSNLSTKMLYIISILEENKDVEGEIFVNTDLNNKGAIFRKKI